MSHPEINEWADFMPRSVTIQPWVSYKGGGSDSNYGDPVTYACRIEMGNHLVVDTLHRTVTARGKVFLLTTNMIPPKSLVTLPSDYIPTQPPILAVDVNDDELGTHHVCLHIG